ncbi:MAG TPA: hypothetical protein VEC60_03710 [Reyranella sp.]|nr:hypothetical protein [Reyranella sp.]
MVRTAFAVIGLGLAAGACSYSSTTATAIPAAPGPVVVASPAGHACVDYGFVPGTIAYNRCVERTEAARVRRVAVTTDAQLAADARDACVSYGLMLGSPHYNRCVDREMDARRIRGDQAAVYVPPQAAAPPAPPPPPAGVQAFRDEYGFRYDGQGNRLDARGNIISPQSTRP